MTKEKKKVKEKFNPSDNLLWLEKKEKQDDGSYKPVKKPYLPVAWRVVWFREDHPKGKLLTKIVERGDGWVLLESEVYDNDGNLLANALKADTIKNFKDYMEKCDTGAKGRALGFAGYGTQFAPDLDEGTRLADAPVENGSKKEWVGGWESEPATRKQVGMIASLAQHNGYVFETVKEGFKKMFGLESFTELNKGQASKIIDHPERMLTEAFLLVHPESREETEKNLAKRDGAYDKDKETGVKYDEIPEDINF